MVLVLRRSTFLTPPPEVPDTHLMPERTSIASLIKSRSYFGTVLGIASARARNVSGIMETVSFTRGLIEG
jgi:hypothetical protein